jgi:23S rRNA pseudouridine1911/1915/1917 synthase
VVVEKPAGLLTAPTPESDRNNLADLLARRTHPPRRVFVVHRLDLETSGLLVFAKSPSANRVLAERFRHHDVEREYLAVVDGAFPEDVRTIDAKVAGRAALSRVAVVRAVGPNTLLRVRLETGRTHQVRVHLASVGHPVCGDRRYGRRGASEPPRMALHATRLGFAHPETGAVLAFDSPWPADLRGWLDGS